MLTIYVGVAGFEPATYCFLSTLYPLSYPTSHCRQSWIRTNDPRSDSALPLSYTPVKSLVNLNFG
ncbi:MAG: hypothetical protein SNI70_09810 [Rikenellaceae bacterium]